MESNTTINNAIDSKINYGLHTNAIWKGLKVSQKIVELSFKGEVSIQFEPYKSKGQQMYYIGSLTFKHGDIRKTIYCRAANINNLLDKLRVQYVESFTKKEKD